jgi:Terminase large subunit, T4likevirus-type, N-terminal
MAEEIQDSFSGIEKINYKDLMVNEYKKCAVDPLYFIANYVYIQTPEGRGLFKLFEFQKKLLNILHTKDRSIILKSRQMGITTLCSAYALWAMLFTQDYVVLALAPDQDKSKEIINKITFGYDNLQPWMIKMCKGESVEKNKFSIKLKNGSRAIAASGASKSARGKTANLLILDEVAFIEKADELFASAQQTLSGTKSKAVLLSTPNGSSGFFHETWAKAELGETDFIPIKLPWNLHPGRDERWRKKQDEELGVRLANQECNCDFLNSGDGYFDSDDIQYYKDSFENPIEMSGPNKDYWIWEHVDYTKNYMITVDTSRGDGNDFNTMHVIDVFTGDQVAEYKGNMDLKYFPDFIVSEAIKYNRALVIIENVGIGQTTVVGVLNTGYSNIYYSPKTNTNDIHKYMYSDPIMEPDKFTPGFTTSTITRPQMLLVFKGHVHDRDIKIRSKRLASEMSTFVWKNGKEQAQSGYNDDLIMSYAIGMYLRNTAMNQSDKGVNMSKALLSNVRRSPMLPMHSGTSNGMNPYQHDFGYGKEDISWILDKFGNIKINTYLCKVV